VCLVAYVINFSATLRSLVNQRMEFKLFPSVTHSTAVLQRTAVFVVLSVFLAEPNRTLLRKAFVDIGFAAEVLPIVSVDALVSCV
jgi:hypothetical protein